jgi:hemoglobin-like flavoprotein
MSATGLTENQIQLIEESFAAVAPRGAALVARFYELLFKDYPEVKPMFKSDSHQQQKKLLGALVLVVENLRKPEKLKPALEQLGIKHNDYDVVPEQYQAVGGTLLKTLAEFAGDLWGSELENAWATAYGAISEQMIESAQLATANA